MMLQVSTGPAWLQVQGPSTVAGAYPQRIGDGDRTGVVARSVV